MGRNGRKRLDQLIDEVARGERQLSSISDAKLREAVRLALRLHDDAPVAPDAYAKRRMRARVMVGLEPHRPTLLDNAWTALELLARPAPYIVRGVAISVVIACLGMSTIVASAETLPDDLLYPVKLATEQVRLALADAPGDRASVELSIAAHRLSEAEQLATSGRTSDALVATALYSQHVATAAAELASQNEASDLDAQLQAAFNAQRDRAQFLAVTLAADVKSARGAQILAMIASPTYAPGQTKIEQVAIAAASVAQQLAIAAGQAAAENEAIATPPPSGTPGGSPTAPIVTAPTAAARATTRATSTATATESSASPTATSATTATTASPAAAASAAASSPTASASGPAASAAAPTTVANTTTTGNTTTATGNTSPTITTTTATTTTTNAPPSNARSAPEAKVTHDPRANDAAKAAKDAAEKAKAAADKLREALKERESKQKGK